MSKKLIALATWCLICVATVSCGGGGGGTVELADVFFGGVAPEAGYVENAPRPLIFGQGGSGASFDLSNDQYLPPVGNQQQIPSCVAWASGYALASYEAAKANGGLSNTTSLQASPADLYAKTLNRQFQLGYPSACSSGSSLELAMDILTQVGVASEAEVPYAAGCVLPSNNRTFVLNVARTIRPSDVDVIKSMIASGHPVAMLVKTYTDFGGWGFGPNRTGVYRGNGVVHPQGNHSMLIVGYNDSLGAWRVMNSWGEEWGDDGFFWLDYGTFQNTGLICSVAENGASLDPDPPAGPVTFTSFDALQYVGFSSGISYIVHPFTLSEPVYVTRGRLIYEENGSSTPWFTANMWMMSSYVWWANGFSLYPPGRYTFELEGVTRDGRDVTVVGTATLHVGGWTYAPSQGGVDASSADQETIRSLPAISSTAGVAQLNPGDQVVVNGHVMTLTER